MNAFAIYTCAQKLMRTPIGWWRAPLLLPPLPCSYCFLPDTELLVHGDILLIVKGMLFSLSVYILNNLFGVSETENFKYMLGHWGWLS